MWENPACPFIVVKIMTMTENSTPKTIYLDQYQPPAWKVKQVDLDFDLREGETLVRARLSIEHSDARESDMFLNGENLELVEISVNGAPLDVGRYQVTEKGLVLSNPPQSFTLETLTRIYPEKNTALEGLYRSSGMYCTQCEAEGFRKITWFPDRPDVMAGFTTRVEADKTNYPVLLSNGNPVENGELENGRHFAVWDDPFPKPSYLFALVAGDLKAVSGKHTTPSGREIELNIYVEEENLDKCDHALRSLINAMQWDEQKYGREYDLDIYNVVAVNDFNMGAMENKGLNIFNSKYVLARQDTATDRDFQGIEGVIAHEYFHNWTGNRITCRDWFQLSLKEGFTVFRDQCFSADMGSEHVKRIEDVRLLRAHQFAEDAGPMAHPVRPASYIEINNFYTVTVYEKGAEVVRMQANLLGPEKFRQATDLYFDRFDGQAVTTEDFMGCMQDTLGRDMSQFQYWYDYAGTPELVVRGNYDTDSKRFELSISQSCPDTPEKNNKPAFFIPFAVGLLDQQGNDLVGTRMLELSKSSQVFSFEHIDAEPVPSLLRGFSAPVKVAYEYSDDQLMFLMEKDSDGFARWDAAQQLSQRILLSMISQYQQELELVVPSDYIKAFRHTLLDINSDKALIAEVITLPSEFYLGDQMQQVDVDAIHSARQTLKQRVAVMLYDDLLSIYQDNQDDGEYRISSEAIARRALKNTVLSYLVLSGNEEAEKICISQYDNARNMTDTMAAFSLITDSDFDQRQQIVDDFEQRWKHDALVMDKWFVAQATSSRETTLDQVKRLMNHELFSITNPNKVRSLVGAFCSANPLRFHQANGAGYRFLADNVIELDKLNPQIAARMLRIISRWNRYDTKRQGLMKTELERVAGVESISSDVFEIASKSLEV